MSKVMETEICEHVKRKSSKKFSSFVYDMLKSSMSGA